MGILQHWVCLYHLSTVAHYVVNHYMVYTRSGTGKESGYYNDDSISGVLLIPSSVTVKTQTYQIFKSYISYKLITLITCFSVMVLQAGL